VTPWSPISALFKGGTIHLTWTDKRFKVVETSSPKWTINRPINASFWWSSMDTARFLFDGINWKFHNNKTLISCQLVASHDVVVVRPFMIYERSKKCQRSLLVSYIMYDLIRDRVLIICSNSSWLNSRYCWYQTVGLSCNINILIVLTDVNGKT